MISYRFQAVFASFVSLVIAIFYYIYRMGFDIDFLVVGKILGVSFFLNLSALFVTQKWKKVNWWNTDAILVFYTLVFLGILGYLTRFLPFLQYLTWVFAIAGYGMSFWVCKGFFKELKWTKILLCFVVATLLGIYFLNENYGKFGYKDSFIEAISAGSKNYSLGTLDMSYHIGIAKMYQTYQVPTTGTDGVVFMHYNTATHWLAGNLSLLLNIPVWLFYNLGYQLIFFSLFFRLLFSFVADFQNYFAKQKEMQPSFGITSWQFWVLVIAIFVPIPNNMYMAGLLGYHFTISVPYTIALCLVWAFLSSVVQFAENKTHKQLFWFVFLPIMLFIMGFSHVATIVIFTACIGYYFLRFEWYRKIEGWLVAAMTVAILFVCYMLTAETTFTGRQHSYEGSWGWFFFFKQHDTQYFNLIVVFYASLYIATFLYLKNERLTTKEIVQERKAFWLEILWIAALAGLAPNVVLQLYGSTGMYFFGLHKWIAGAFLLAYLPFVKIDFLEKKWVIYAKMLAVAAILIIFTGKFFKNMDAGIKKSLDVRATILGEPKIQWKARHFVTKLFCCKEEWDKLKRLGSSQVQAKINQNEFYQIIKSWEKLDSLPISVKKESLLHIPYKEWTISKDTAHYEYQEVPMIAPYITGIATLHGLPSPEFPIGAYGYSYYNLATREKIWKEGYSTEELKQIAKAQGAKYLWIYSFKTKTFQKITL